MRTSSTGSHVLRLLSVTSLLKLAITQTSVKSPVYHGSSRRSMGTSGTFFALGPFHPEKA